MDTKIYFCLKFIFVLIILILSSVQVQNLNIDSTEVTALEDFYIATNGDNWDYEVNETHWNFSDVSNICSWKGLVCSKKCLSNYCFIQSIKLAASNLNGNIPKSIGNLNKISVLNLSSNHLYGSIPDTIKEMSQLIYLDLSQNYLSHTIPSEIFSLLQLNILFLYSNHLSGTISENVGNLQKIINLKLIDNLLYGSLPSSIGKLSQLQILGLGVNHLTGTFPKSLLDLKNLTILDLNTNLLFGTVPSEIYRLKNLNYLVLFSNLFSGPIPSNLQSLQIMELDYNYFSGSIPLKMSNMSQLTRIILNNNHLTGVILNRFIPKQINLTIIQLSNNQFTGDLPNNLYQLLNLKTFAVVDNCFNPSIPYESFCSSKSLQNLFLDGLHAGSSCQKRLFKYVLPSVYSVHSYFFSAINPCLFKIENIKTLHLSGNGFSGDLPSGLVLSNSLTELVLSSNSLTGKIPLSIQSKKWSTLDLSYNKFTGVIATDFAYQNATGSTILLNNNRLSGIIPSSLFFVPKLNILSGNIFTCLIYDHRNTLPLQDPSYNKYHCGSNYFNVSLFCWMGVTFVVMIAYFVSRPKTQKHIDSNKSTANPIKQCVQWFKEQLPSFQRDWNLSSSIYGDYIHIDFMLRKLNILVKISMFIVVYIMTIMIIIYSPLGVYYGTYEYEYAWTISAGYKIGVLPFALILVSWMILLTFLLSMTFIARPDNIMKHTKVIDKSRDSNQSNNTDINRESDDSNKPSEPLTTNLEKSQFWPKRIQYWTAWLVCPLVNFLIVGGVNVTYVILSFSVTEGTFVVIQISLALFKIVWNSVLYVYVNRHINKCLDVKTSSPAYSLFDLLVLLICNITIPCIVVSLIESSCFYNLFNAKNPVIVNINYPVCLNYIGNACVQYGIRKQTSSFEPPFFYSYSCSSRFVVLYAGVYMYYCIFDSFGLIFLQYLLLRFYQMMRKTDIKCFGVTWCTHKEWFRICCCNCSGKSGEALSLYWLVNKLVPRILKLEDIDLKNDDTIRVNTTAPIFDSLATFKKYSLLLAWIMTYGRILNIIMLV